MKLVITSGKAQIPGSKRSISTGYLNSSTKPIIREGKITLEIVINTTVIVGKKTANEIKSVLEKFLFILNSIS